MEPQEKKGASALIERIDFFVLFHKESSPSSHIDEGFIANVLRHEFRAVFNNFDPTSEFQLLYGFCLRYLVKLASPKHVSRLIADSFGSVKELISKLAPCEYLLPAVYLSAYTLFGLFLKESWLGKSFLYADSDKKIKREGKIKLKIEKKTEPVFDFAPIVEKYFKTEADAFKDLNEYSFRFMKSQSNVKDSPKEVFRHLSLGGEDWFKEIPFSNLFCVAKETFEALKECGDSSLTYELWIARINFIHNVVLDTPVDTLNEKIFRAYERFFEKLGKPGEKCDPRTYSELKAEHGNCYIFYYKYKKALVSYLTSQKLIKLKLNLTGKMGVRTKYQTFKVPQLIAEATNESDVQLEAKILAEEKKDIPEAEAILEKVSGKGPQKFDLEEDSILYEEPKVEESEKQEGDATTKSELDLHEQITVLGLIKNYQKSMPNDEILQEQISAYIDLVLKKSNNWLIYSMALIVRSVNEFSRWKKKERSLLQLQALVDQYNQKEGTMFERSQYLFSVTYPSYLDLQKLLAEKYMEMGAVLSACQLFEQLKMFEYCVECLAMAGHMDRAKKLGLELSEKDPSPKLLCLCGDIFQDKAYYKRAWKLSEKRFARAQRSLGRVYFFENDFKRSIRSYRKALKANTYHSGAWFTLGCAYMKIGDFRMAIQAFSSCVQIDESQGEAWANLSAALLQEDKKLEALATLEQAVKHCEGSWRMWQNLMMISLELKKFAKFIEAIERLVHLQRKEIIDDIVLKKVNQILDYQTAIMTEANRRNSEFYRERLNKLYKMLTEALGEKFEVWDNFGDYQLLLIQHFRKSSQLRLKAFENESQPEEQTKGVKFAAEATDFQKKKKEVAESLEKNEGDILNKIGDVRLNACQCLMVVDWEKDKKTCERLLYAAEKLIVSYKNVKGEADMTKLKILIDTIKPKLESQLERAVKLEV